MARYPQWLKKSFSADGTAREVRTLLGDLALATVCESAWCPNLRECYSQRQLTFMILGERCTRRCRFCAVEHGRVEPPDPAEPWRVAEAVKRLQLRHVVITSVARDDLNDEGVAQFIGVVGAVREHNPGVTVETLVPDFHGRPELIRRLMDEAHPEVLAHNIETVDRLSELLRPQASYRRSVEVLRYAASLRSGSLVKSGVMVGLGETPEELERTLQDLVGAGVTHLTIGQYLRPDAEHLPVMEYVSPSRFDAYEALARRTGLRWVRSGPFVRSSYHAVDALHPSADAAEMAHAA